MKMGSLPCVGGMCVYQYFVIFTVEVFYFLKFIPSYLKKICSDCEWIALMDSFSANLLLLHKATTDQLYVDFVFCNITEFIYQF